MTSSIIVPEEPPLVFPAVRVVSSPRGVPFGAGLTRSASFTAS